jgi:hypothetical protein
VQTLTMSSTMPTISRTITPANIMCARCGMDVHAAQHQHKVCDSDNHHYQHCTRSSA